MDIAVQRGSFFFFLPEASLLPHAAGGLDIASVVPQLLHIAALENCD